MAEQNGRGASPSKQGHRILIAHRRMERALLAVGHAERHLSNDAACSPDRSEATWARV